MPTIKIIGLFTRVSKNGKKKMDQVLVRIDNRRLCLSEFLKKQIKKESIKYPLARGRRPAQDSWI